MTLADGSVVTYSGPARVNIGAPFTVTFTVRNANKTPGTGTLHVSFGNASTGGSKASSGTLDPADAHDEHPGAAIRELSISREQRECRAGRDTRVGYSRGILMERRDDPEAEEGGVTLFRVPLTMSVRREWSQSLTMLSAPTCSSRITDRARSDGPTDLSRSPSSVSARAATLAARLRDAIRSNENATVPLGSLDITLYRDDLTRIGYAPIVHESALDFSVDDKVVVLVDDVLFTGRTIRAAMDALVDYGRPRAIRLAVLVDRGHRELPIRADFVGKNVPTKPTDDVRVHLTEVDGRDEVELIARERVGA